MLAVHILAAGKRRKEEACGPGGGTPAQIPQDVVSWLPAHPLVTGLLAKAGSAQLRGGKATSRGRHSSGRENTSPHHSPSTDKGAQDSTEILPTVMDPRQGCVSGLPCKHVTSHGSWEQSLTATSPVLPVLSDLDKKQGAFGRYPYCLVHCISAGNSLLLPKLLKK